MINTVSVSLSSLSFSCFTEIDKAKKDDDNEDEKFIDVVVNKNMKLGQKVLIPVKQFPKVGFLSQPGSLAVRLLSLVLTSAIASVFHLSNVFGLI